MILPIERPSQHSECCLNKRILVGQKHGLSAEVQNNTQTRKLRACDGARHKWQVDQSRIEL